MAATDGQITLAASGFGDTIPVYLRIFTWRVILGFLVLTVYILLFTSTSRTIWQMFEKTMFSGNRGQKVISFSLFNRSQLNMRYMPGLMENYWRMEEFYPGWVMRVYTNISNISSQYSQPDLYFYDTNNLTNLGDVSGMEETVWRFLPIGDPTVDIFISRDLDSLMGERERAAVTQWEESTAVFHSMKDHPFHGVSILAGMWGAKNYMLNFTTREYLQNEFIKNRDNDQILLDKIFYHNPDFNFKDMFMNHDSFFCKYFGNTIPFPTQRKNTADFVGNYDFGMDPVNVTECPVECRPSYGKDWTYC